MRYLLKLNSVNEIQWQIAIWKAHYIHCAGEDDGHLWEQKKKIDIKKEIVHVYNEATGVKSLSPKLPYKDVDL